MAYEPQVENEAPDPEAFCAPEPPAVTPPVIRFPGGATLVPVVDISRGAPGSCGVSLPLVASLQAALAPLQPILTILDLLSTLVQFVLVIPEVIGNPLKIGKLIRLVPGLAGKLNGLLALIPPLPSGAIAFATFIADVLAFAATQVACVAETLRSVQEELDAVDREVAKSQAVDDPDLAAQLAQLAECGRERALARANGALAVLSPIARIVCTIRAILSLIPGGSVIADQIRLPATADVVDLTGAIAALEGVRDGLLGAANAIRLTGLALPGLDDLNFICALDTDTGDGAAEAPVDPNLPTIERLYPTDLPFLTVTTIPQADDSTEAPFTVGVLGSHFTAATAVYFGAVRIDQARVRCEDAQHLIIDIPASLRLAEQTVYMFAANGVPSPDYIPPPFQGAGEDAESSGPVKISEPFETEIS